MFAIYSSAVLSLTKDECKEMLGESRETLLPHYREETKAALARAGFMSSTSIVVLQALLLHIISIRDDYEPRAVWILTGVAIRVAEGMGMRLDGTLLGLPPFETEIRRRIWWQLRMHDFRAAELCGQAKFRDFKLDETTPKKPANVNDSELYPTMLQAPVESTKPTEMIWCVFRTELASFAAAQIARMQKYGKTGFSTEEYAAMDDLKIKDVFISELEDVIETKYLRFCDPSQPLQLLTLVVGRSAINLVRFMAHHPRRWATLERVPESEQKLVWEICIQLLEQYNMMQSSPQLRRFVWTVPYFLNWPAIIHVLDTLQVEPLHKDAEKAWRLIDNIYEAYSEMLLNLTKPIFAAVGGLCLKAYSARKASLAKQKWNLSDPPEYITKLQEHREAAKARRKSAIAKSKGQRPLQLDGGNRLATMHADTISSEANLSSDAETLVEVPPQQQQYPQAANHIHGISSAWGADDAFWLDGSLDDTLFANGATDMMNLDTDAILAQDYWIDPPNGEAMDWAQWDAWLGNSDPMRPNVGP
jgi:Fungal specific transcription factor domain